MDILSKEKKCDVLVAGGGIAGIAAALAAARNGASVILAEKQCALGGLATLGLISIYLPLCDGEGHQVTFGIGEELLKSSILYGCEGRYPDAWLEGSDTEKRKEQRYEVQFNPWLFCITAERLLMDAGVEILYDTLISDVQISDNRICNAYANTIEGCCRITPGQVIDATGDAVICRIAGEKTDVYTQNRFAAWFCFSGNGEVRLNGYAAPLYGELPAEEKYYDGNLEKDRNEMIIRGHQEILRELLSIRAKKKRPDIALTAIPLVPQFRMTRRLSGQYELDDAEDHRFFPDSVGMIGDWRKRGPVYEIPFRCLLGNKIRNLFAAGRCISAATGMWDITRVIPACAVTGEAAGTAAAQLSSRNSDGDICGPDIRLIQEALYRKNVKLHITEL